MPKRPVLSWFVSLIVTIPTVAIGAENPPIKAGEKVVAVADTALLVGRETLATVSVGTELDAEAVQDQWVWVALQHSGKTVRGWIDSHHLTGRPQVVDGERNPRIPAAYVGVWAEAGDNGKAKTLRDGTHVGAIIVREKYLIWVQRSLSPGPDDFQTCTVSCPTTWKLNETTGSLDFTARQSMGIDLPAKRALTRDASATIRREHDKLLLEIKGNPVTVQQPDFAVAPGSAVVVGPAGEFSLVGGGIARAYLKVGK
jgi:hypothetical protein